MKIVTHPSQTLHAFQPLSDTSALFLLHGLYCIQHIVICRLLIFKSIKTHYFFDMMFFDYLQIALNLKTLDFLFFYYSL